MIAFIRMHPNLVFLWHKGRNFRDVMGDCQLAIPNNFITSILAGPGNWTPFDSILFP